MVPLSRSDFFILFGFIFLIVSIIFLVTLIFKSIFPIVKFPHWYIVGFLLFYLVCLYSIIVNITGKRSESQPWYSIFFTIYSYSIPFFIIYIAYYVLNQPHYDILANSVTVESFEKLLFIVIMFLAILLIFSTNNRYLRFGIWKNHYESNQILSNLKITTNNPSIIQLNLLQKIGNSMNDRDTIFKLIMTFQEIIDEEGEYIKPEFITGLFNFVNNQLEIESDNETYDLLFELANTLLDTKPAYADRFFASALNLFKTGNSVIKNGSLNILGHILQINPERKYIEQIYNELEKNFYSTDDNLKRLTLDALMYFTSNFPDYNSKIKTLITTKLEYETFGIATNIFSILDNIFQTKKDESIYSLAQETLVSLDSPAKLGAVNFLRKNFPIEQNKRDMFIKLFIQNLKDIDNAIGVRTNIVYTINDIITNSKNEDYLLAEIKPYIADFDPDVKSAVIQTFADQYILRNAHFEDVEEVFEKGMSEHDYVVRLVVLQSIKSIKQQEDTIDTIFIKILEKARLDESQVIQDEAQEILKL